MKRVLLLYNIDYRYATQEGYEDHKDRFYMDSDIGWLEPDFYYYHYYGDRDRSLLVYYSEIVTEDTLDKMNYVGTTEQHYKAKIQREQEQWCQEDEHELTFTIKWDCCKETQLRLLPHPAEDINKIYSATRKCIEW